uniref:TGF_BETA_2 domain-containing protein n=1 Tax=Strongyloides papillosus TaxID=174720 RepID=A0A0N5CDQ8_STREA
MSEKYENDCRIISNIVDVSTTYPDVVLQKNYDIGKCSGSCALTRRKIIDGKEVIEKITNDCIPTDIHFLRIYLFDRKTSRINLHEIHEVVVNKCGCKF